MEKVRTLYDFEGDADNQEISFFVGEIITVLDKEVGEGWWQGRKEDGSTGLFPQTYVEVVEETSDVGSNLAHPQVDASQFGNEDTDTDNFDDDFDDDMFGLGIHPSEKLQQIPTDDTNQAWSDQNYNNPNDDWGENYQEDQQAAPAPPSAPPIADQSTSPVKRSGRQTTLKVSKNLLSPFMKTAGVSYVLGEAKFDVRDVRTCRVVMCDDGPMWDSHPAVFSCTVSDPVKESKFSGFKSFIAYNIKPSHTGESVLRRFKHFDWLHEQLAKKYGVAIAVPFLPDKQLTGRYEDDFIEERRSQLEAWISRMGLHPVISHAQVLQHFVTSKDDEKAWKAGKRRAEKDEAVGGAFLNTVQTPDQQLDLAMAEQTLDTHVKFTKSMEDACKHLLSLGHEQVKKYTSGYRKDYEKLGQIFHLFSDSFALDEREVALPLTQAMKHTGECFHDIGELFDGQPKYDWNPLLTGINEYKSVLSTFPNIFTNQKTALEKNKEVRRLNLESKVTTEEMLDVISRTEKLSYVVQAEVNHLQHYRVGDFAVYMKNFLQQQIAFHQEIIKKLEEAALDYRDMVPS